MSSEEKRIRVKRLRIVADQLVIEPDKIVIKRPKKKREEEKDILGFEEEFEGG